jgi:hypothetical protein
MHGGVRRQLQDEPGAPAPSPASLGGRDADREATPLDAWRADVTAMRQQRTLATFQKPGIRRRRAKVRFSGGPTRRLDP